MKFGSVFARRRLQLADAVLNAAIPSLRPFRVALTRGNLTMPVRAEFHPAEMRLVFADDGEQITLFQQAVRMYSVAKVLSSCDATRGALDINVHDSAFAPGLAFCSNRADSLLIPDHDFIESQGYRKTIAAFDDAPVAWDTRRPVAFWRGSTTGYPADCADRLAGHVSGEWETLPRIRLCEIAKGHPYLFDAGITSVVQTGDNAAAIAARGVMRDVVPITNLHRYRWQIDVDGNSNAWSGFFQKLASGSPVLKVDSPFNDRQWYYDRLQPFVHFVPVRADLADLVEKVRWLRSNDEDARRIGEAGSAFARAMTVESEMKRARDAVDAALAAEN